MTKTRNNVNDTGETDLTPLVFVHGFGCDQSMWSDVAALLAGRFRLITYDLTGMGRSDLAAYDFDAYSDLHAHAVDLTAICDDLDLRGAVLVGHSVGATIALLAARDLSDRVSQVVLVSPSPCFVNDAGSGYTGGFERSDLEGMVQLLEQNHLGWSAQMAPTIAGQSAGEPAADKLTQSFCRTDPTIAQHFARVTFFTDARGVFSTAEKPALVLHCDKDALVPMAVADWMGSAMPDARVEVLDAVGHCPHMTVPDDVVRALVQFVEQAR